MGLVMVCPQCQAKVLLQCQSCPYCQSDLRDVPQDQRRYSVGQPGPYIPPVAPEPVTTSPAFESASVPELPSQPTPSSEAKIRRPHVRRYAAPPVAQTHPVTAQPAAGAEANVKIRRPHVKRYAAPPVAQTHPVTAQPSKKAATKTEAKKPKKPRAAAGKKKK